MKQPADPAAQARGRTDARRRLLDRVRSADASYLEGVLENPALDEELAVILLRNRRASPEILRRLASDARLRRSNAVRQGLVCHPRTPRGLALNQVALLPWRSLAEAAGHVLTPPPVRRAALRTLRERFEEMALGERTNLARTAGRAVLTALVQSSRPDVMRALLTNPHLTEDDVVGLCSRRETGPDVLAQIARSRRWTRRYRVRRALAHHDRAPLGVILGLLTGLLSTDLEEVSVRPDRPPAVRMAARRILRRRDASSGGRRPRAPEVYVLEVEDAG